MIITLVLFLIIMILWVLYEKKCKENERIVKHIKDMCEETKKEFWKKYNVKN